MAFWVIRFLLPLLLLYCFIGKKQYYCQFLTCKKGNYSYAMFLKGMFKELNFVITT